MRERDRLQPPPVAGLSRCPFCHDDVRVATDAWVACEQCLARHHDGCWVEGAGCSSCAAQRALARPARRRSLAPLALVVGVALGWVLGLRFDTIRRLVEPEPVATHMDGPAGGREVPGYVFERIDFMMNEDRPDDAERYAQQMLEAYPDAGPELREYLDEARRRTGH